MNEQISSVERVRLALAQAGVETRIEEFPASTRTAQDAATAIGTSVGQIVKSLVFYAGEAPVLALMSGSNRLDTDRLAGLTGAVIRKAGAEEVRMATGYAIGGIPPVGFARPIPTFIDADVLHYAEIWAAAGTPHHVFRIRPSELVRVTGGTVGELRSR